MPALLVAKFFVYAESDEAGNRPKIQTDLETQSQKTSVIYVEEEEEEEAVWRRLGVH